MRNIIIIFKKELKRFFTDKRMLASMFLPGVLIFVMYTLMGKLMQGNISSAKGTTDTFSFKIPITKNIEPMIISFYSLNDDYMDDRFNSDLFVKNIYLDKMKLFKYYGINEHSYQQNFYLYTDDIVNDILSNIIIDNNQIIIENPMVLDALINC